MNRAEIPKTPAQRIIADTCRDYKIPRKDLLGPTKRFRVSKVRQRLYCRLVLELGLSFPVAGRLIGKRDHSTVIYGVRKFSAEHFGTPPKAGLAEMRAAYLASLQADRVAA